MTRDYSRRDDHRRVDYAHRGRRDDRDRSRSRDGHRGRRHDDDKRHHGDDKRRRDRSRSPVRRDERRGGERDRESRRDSSPRKDRDSRRDRSPRPPIEPPAPSPTPVEQPAKSRSGIFQYISELAPQTQPEQSRSQQPSRRQEERRRDRDDGLKPNAGVLRREIDSQGKLNAKMDAREREGANKRLKELETVRDVGRPTERVNEAGVVIKDDYSRGVHADVAARRDLPYVCEKCSSASFVLATQLSDHLLKVHNVHRHPSQIVPKTVIKA